ncbi:hypothetical protein L2Y90_31305 (plasmid) [Burkholderia pyrrocinia]|uniref:hypothetical protein n=1 Tax=Burkholderia pyrrocinia TaxID=60550 RepID=UPI00215A2834|nr:hypothetical protein [Burkholderia pyrrocinia]UVE70318.1 hypothetical protein L2Y90_31305 [Burkholderia pyrrocinia]
MIPFLHGMRSSYNPWGHCFLLPDIEADWFWMTGNPRKNIERIQCFLTYLIAAEACDTYAPYGIEKRLKGAEFRNVDRARFWDRVARGDYQLYTRLKRKQSTPIKQWELLSSLTNKAEELRTSPLWDLLLNDTIPVYQLIYQRNEIERICDYKVPLPPSSSISDATRYVDELFCGTLAGKEFRSDSAIYSQLLMGVYCLRLAGAKWNLAQYILTYEGLFNVFFLHHSYDKFQWILWGEILGLVNQWYRELQILPSTSPDEDILDKCMNLQQYGIRFHPLNRKGKILFISLSSSISGYKSFFGEHLRSFVWHAQENPPACYWMIKNNNICFSTEQQRTRVEHYPMRERY